jgi:membrane fusion protein, copper/silver efflux system
MLSGILKKAVYVIIAVFIFTGLSIAQDKNDNQDSGKTKMNHMQMDHSQMKQAADSTSDTSIVREGVIDLNAIDANKDGKVYQDMMDYNVISDTPGTCPLCGMTLKEVSLEKAKMYLEKTGHKVK